ncbi:hypothetical protein MRB53_003532 [Persea americana]|uniref:Uncharacterized protein n=1 Tax=Persea americana TaxID=3435 RepID=A0ACC2MXR6_PERAE|nr:hypothetical protein MRB53_003532 [Persea americana]
MVLDFLEEMEKMPLPPARSYVKNTKAMFRTPADVYEHPDSYHFVLDMPGLQVENIKVISYQPPLSDCAHVYNADPENVTATYKDGVLTVVVAKKQAEEAPSKPKTITIPVS